MTSSSNVPGKRKRTRRTQRRGYVLIVTLFIVAMVGILTAGLARHSMNMAVASIANQERLQSRWGTASCQRFALKNQARLLGKKSWNQTTETWESNPIARSICQFELGEQLFLVRLDDESAKLNLNHITETENSSKTNALIRQLADVPNISIKLRPLSESRSRGPTEHPFESWGQVFNSSVSESLPPSMIREVSTELTCWGENLNYVTASDDVLLESAKLLVGGSIAQRLLRLRNSSESNDLKEILTELSATERQTRKLEGYLTNHSETQSVWVESISRYNRIHTLTVREEFTSSISRIYSFTW